MLKSDITVQSILMSPGLPLMTVATTLDCSFLIHIEDYSF